MEIFYLIISISLLLAGLVVGYLMYLNCKLKKDWNSTCHWCGQKDVSQNMVRKMFAGVVGWEWFCFGMYHPECRKNETNWLNGGPEIKERLNKKVGE